MFLFLLILSAMTHKVFKTTAQIVSWVFHPFVIPTFGILLIMNSMPGFDHYPIKAKGVLLLIVFLSTGLLPILFTLITTLLQSQNPELNSYRNRVVPYFFTAISIFIGAQFLAKLPIPPIFRLIMVGSGLILVLLFMFTIRWKISGHTTALGGLLGTLLALTFKYGLNLLWPVVMVILISGAVGTSLIYLNKHIPWQVYVPFAASLVLMYLMVYLF